jgi:glutamate racemase
VLGCTHYPFLIEVLEKLLPKDVKIIDPSPAIVKQVERILELNNMFNEVIDKRKYDFYSSGNSEVLKNLLKRITDIDYKIIEL